MKGSIYDLKAEKIVPSTAQILGLGPKYNGGCEIGWIRNGSLPSRVRYMCPQWLAVYIHIYSLISRPESTSCFTKEESDLTLRPNKVSAYIALRFRQLDDSRAKFWS